MLADKRLVVTGGTGSLGKVLVRRLLSGDLGIPKSIIVFSRDETKQHQMRLDYQHRAVATDEVIYHNFEQILQFQIGDVRDYHSVCSLLRNVDVVFNAAALKQVPTCEYFPFEAVQTNIIGAENIVRAIRENQLPVETVIGISTDKACKPVNVMGMTKKIGEMMVSQAAIETGNPYVSVRFGNVLGSRGSVVPFFKDQIAAGGPVTITHPDVERFFMTISEAVQLVLQASALGSADEIFVLDMGEQIKIRDLAVELIQLSGLEVGEDIEIIYTGLRPGEKLSEELFTSSENPLSTDHEKIRVVMNNSKSLTDSFNKELEMLLNLARKGDTKQAREKLQKLSLLSDKL